MGRKNKKYYKDLHQQAYDKLTGMQGEYQLMLASICSSQILEEKIKRFWKNNRRIGYELRRTAEKRDRNNQRTYN